MIYRKYLYYTFGYLYGVDYGEIEVIDMNDFRTFNAFFTRKLKEGARVVENAQDVKSVCSPCDGRVLAVGMVDSLKSTIDCIKGHDYRLDEFLLGYKVEKDKLI